MEKNKTKTTAQWVHHEGNDPTTHRTMSRRSTMELEPASHWKCPIHRWCEWCTTRLQFILAIKIKTEEKKKI